MRDTFLDGRKKNSFGLMSTRPLPGLPASPVEELTGQLRYAVACHKAGRLDEAEKEYRKIIKRYPRQADALHLLGVVFYQKGAHLESLRHIDRALKTEPNAPDAHVNRANTLRALNRLGEARAACDRAIALKPEGIEAYNARGAILIEMHHYEEALASCDRALALNPDYAFAHSNRGNALKALKRRSDALASYGRALTINANFAEAYSNRAAVLNQLQRFDEALADCDRAITLAPNLAEAHFNRGLSLGQLGKTVESLAAFDRAIALKPDYADAYFARGAPCQMLKRADEALASLDRAINLNPNIIRLRGLHLHAKMVLCDWRNFEADRQRLENEVIKGNQASPPFQMLAYSSDMALQRACARFYLDDINASNPDPLWRGERYGHSRIRVAYLSADFRHHPVALLTAGMFERHDRSRFETIGISFGGSDEPGPFRQRLEAGFDRFIDAERTSGQEIARLMREMEIDIAVDLNGFTDGGRPDVLLRRPVPVQVNYLGYPGTLGSRCWDYVLADSFVIPEGDRAYYDEQVVYLPHCFMANDSSRTISERMPTRAEFGLPETGFVFCSFNNSYKITPDRFDVWMRLLKQVDGSVLWLSQVGTTAAANLRREATARGVAPDRLIFSSRLPRIEDHLARLNLADLFLDTRFYNGHATIADALWAGVPVLTCVGTTFASRVAGSLLQAVGLPELMAANVADYEAQALRLARDPDLLGSLRAKLAANRRTRPLFDTERFTRNFEAAYVTMWERTQNGEAPQSFAVAPENGGLI
jgi:protein O-GlcNAc transferase